MVGAIAMLGSVIWVASSNWEPIIHSHPSYLVFYVLLLGLGVRIAWLGIKQTDSTPARRGLSVAGGIGMLMLAVLALWLSPFGADDRALEVLNEARGLAIRQNASRIVLDSGGDTTGVGLVFHPGARVDARAYVRTLLPLAESGHRVVIIKEPLGISFLSFGSTASVIEDNPDISGWVVGGHSLGGVAASSDARSDEIDGLLLWASFPASALSRETSLVVASIYGTADGLSEPARVEASSVDLPPSTVFTAVEGAIHSFFGDYGLQPGDGSPGVDRDTAQIEIAEASLELLNTVSRR